MYRTCETDSRFETSKPTSFQATPIVVDGVMYLSTPLGRVVALDPASGDELWVFDPNIRRDITTPVSRFFRRTSITRKRFGLLARSDPEGSFLGEPGHR